MIHPTYDNTYRTEAYLTDETKKCQCSLCYLVFSTEANFDKHRKGDYAGLCYCATPLEVGLVARCTKTGVVYGQPSANLPPIYYQPANKEKVCAA